MNDGELEGVHIFDSMHGQEAMNIIFGRSPWCSKPYWLEMAYSYTIVLRRLLTWASLSLYLICESDRELIEPSAVAARGVDNL